MYTGVTSAKKVLLYRQAEAEMVVLVDCPALPCRVEGCRVRLRIKRYEFTKGETAVL
jgi:hypothetical protein